MRKAPIFLVGCPRSGTTLLRLMLDAHPNICVGPETHFLSQMESIVGVYWEHMQEYGFEKAYWLEKMAAFFDAFKREHAEAQGKTRWADKTPRYIEHLDLLDALFPDSQFVHVIRDGRDVVASHKQRWGYRAALGSIRKWRRYVAAGQAFGARLAPGRYFEVRYEHLVMEPERAMRDLLSYLDEPWDDRVLTYAQRPGGLPPKHRAMTRQRREEAGTEATFYTSRVGAGRRELDPLLHLLFNAHARTLGQELGYR